MTEHTAGKWWYCKREDYDDIFIYAVGSSVHLATAVNCEPEMNEANARLIAKAPDLLEALKKIAALPMFRHNIDVADSWVIDATIVKRIAQAAIGTTRS